MKLYTKIISYIFLSWTLTIGSCAEPEDTKTSEDEEQTTTTSPTPATSTSTSTATFIKQDCSDKAPAITINSISSFVSFVNELPKPTQITCVISALPRPILIAATSNDTSAQGATGEKSPRIFLKYDALILSFVAEGFLSDAIELSETLADNIEMSIKAEIKFPIVSDLEESNPFDRVHIGAEPSCASLCHEGYQEVKVHDGGIVEYASAVIYPKPIWDITLATMQGWEAECNGDNTQLCVFYDYLLNHGTITDFKFSKLYSK